MYIRITEHNYTFIDRPDWIGDDNKPMTDEALADQGIYKVINIKPEYDKRTHTIELSNARSWKQEGIQYIAEYDLKPIDLSILKNEIKNKITEKRWEVMTGGLKLPNGTRIATTVEDQNRISTVVSNSHLAGLTKESKVDFKAKSGWVTLTIGELETLTGLIGKFLQRCYTAERQHHEAVDALSDGLAIVDYDFNKGWNDNE